jgi:acyl carrier protein
VALGPMAPPEVGALEAHGTGTALGDPTEAGALVGVHGAAERATPLVASAAKASVGHSEAASGQVGVLRVAQTVDGATAAGNAQLRTLNPLVGERLGARGACFVLPVQGVALRGAACGVSSFGYSGTIAHAVLQGAAGAQAAAVMVHPPLAYRRRAFPWRDLVGTAPTVGMYAACWSPASRAEAAPSRRHLDSDTPLMQAGVTSQQAVRLAAQLHELSSVALSATLIFEYPTPRAIFDHLSTASEADGRSLSSVDLLTAAIDDLLVAGTTPSEALPRAEADTTVGFSVDAALPASTFQQHFLLLHLLKPHVASYSLPVMVEWPGRYRQPLVRAALQLLVRRHAVLRTFYAMVQTSVIQVILPADGFVVPLNVCSEEDWHAQSAQMLSEPFALTKAPPVRALLMSSEAWQCTRLLVVVDHVATDHASTLVIQRELHLACDALRQGMAPALPRIQLQYADFSLWQLRQRSGDDKSTLNWWRRKLDGAPQLLEVPLDRPRAADQALGSSVSVPIDSVLGTNIAALCGQERVSAVSILVAAWAACLMRHAGQEEVVLGQPYSVQLEYAELQDVVGCFATPVPIRVTTASQMMPCCRLFADVYAELLQAVAHANVPLYQIVDVFKPVRSSSYNPLFQTICQVLPQDRRAIKGTVASRDAETKVGIQLQGIDLFLNFGEQADGSFAGLLLFNAAIFDSSTAQQMIDDFVCLLRHMVAVPDAPLDTTVCMVMSTPRAGSALLIRRRRFPIVLGSHGARVSPFEVEETKAKALSTTTLPPSLEMLHATLQFDNLLDTVLNAVQTLTRNTQVAPDTPLMDAGLNSLNAAQLAVQLEGLIGVSLSPVLIFQYSTAAAIAKYLYAELAPALPEQQSCAAYDAPRRFDADVHVTGTAARFPHGTGSDGELARLAVAAYDAVSEVPAMRWLVADKESLCYPAVQFVAYVPHEERFDSSSFSISPAEATWMDPQQRLLLESGYAGLHSGGQGRCSVMESTLSVVVGIQANDFGSIATSTTALPVYAMSGSTFSVAAGRLSFVLGMRGMCAALTCPHPI